MPTIRRRSSNSIRNEVTMGALKGAAIKMGALREGRKSIIFVSEGFTGIAARADAAIPIASMPGVRQSVSRCGRRARRRRRTRDQLFAEAEMIFDMQRGVRRDEPAEHVDLRRRSARPGGVRVRRQQGRRHPDRCRRPARQTQDTLHVLADNTDGRAIVNRNDLDVGMKQIMRDSSGYYLLGYNSTQAPTDGKFHTSKST